MNNALMAGLRFGASQLVSKLTGNNPKAQEALNQAFQESTKYTPTLANAVSIAKQIGFTSDQIALLRQKALGNSWLSSGINAFAPGAFEELNNISKQVEAELAAGKQTSFAANKDGPPTMNKSTNSGTSNALSERLARLKM